MRLALCVANSEAQASILLEHALALVKSSPVLSGELVAETQNELTFRGGRVLRVLTCSARTARGLEACFVALDEFGWFLTTDEGPRAAARVWAAVRPAVAAFGREGKVLALSTPGDTAASSRSSIAKPTPASSRTRTLTRSMNCRISSSVIGSRAWPSTVWADNRYLGMLILLVTGGHFPPLTLTTDGPRPRVTRTQEGSSEADDVGVERHPVGSAVYLDGKDSDRATASWTHRFSRSPFRPSG